MLAGATGSEPRFSDRWAHRCLCQKNGTSPVIPKRCDVTRNPSPGHIVPMAARRSAQHATIADFNERKQNFALARCFLKCEPWPQEQLSWLPATGRHVFADDQLSETISGQRPVHSYFWGQ